MSEQAWVHGDWMQTYTGKRFYPLSPIVTDIDPLDVAHSLALQCRYNGHVDRFYSVAEHCVLLSRWAEEHGHTRLVQLEALLHDATETYVGDMIRPLKHTDEMKPYRDAEAVVQLAVWQRFSLPVICTLEAEHDGDCALVPVESPTVKQIDTRIALDERNALLSNTRHPWAIDSLQPLGVPVQGWAPREAESAYLKRLEELW